MAEDYVFVDSEQLIYEVEKRPQLYDISSADYNDRSKKAKCWEEVCETVFPNWNELVPAEKSNRSRDIQKRWRSIRDSFMKAYRKWKNPTEVTQGKGKRYVYFKQMMFMIPAIEKRLNYEKNDQAEIPQAEISKVEISPKIEESSDISEKQLDPDITYDEEDIEHQIYEPMIEITSRKRSRSEFEPEMFRNILKRHREPSDEDDEDKMFLLSLMSSFRKMDEDVKLATRIEILQVVKRNLHAVYIPSATNGQRI